MNFQYQMECQQERESLSRTWFALILTSFSHRLVAQCGKKSFPLYLTSHRRPLFSLSLAWGKNEKKKKELFFFLSARILICMQLPTLTRHFSLTYFASFSSFFLPRVRCSIPLLSHKSRGKKRKENKDVVMVGGKSQDSAQEGGPTIKQKCGFIIQIQALGGIFITKFGITTKHHKVFSPCIFLHLAPTMIIP